MSLIRKSLTTYLQLAEGYLEATKKAIRSGNYEETKRLSEEREDLFEEIYRTYGMLELLTKKGRKAFQKIRKSRDLEKAYYTLAHEGLI